MTRSVQRPRDRSSDAQAIIIKRRATDARHQGTPHCRGNLSRVQTPQALHPPGKTPCRDSPRPKTSSAPPEPPAPRKGKEATQAQETHASPRAHGAP